MRILLVDDDQTLIDVLSRSLAEQNYAVDAVTDGEQGWLYGSTYNYDLIILDWSLPKLDGISLCQRFRANGYEMPILLLTARHGSQDKIKGLDAGADDYICKPFDLDELTARIRALLRRLNCDFLPVLSWGELQLDPCSCEVTYQGEILSLTAKEYSLLELFLRHSQEVLSIEEIIESLWSSAEYPAEATVRSHLRYLRQKLKLAGLPEDLIETIPGRGYSLKSLPQEELSVELETPEIKRSRHLNALSAAWEKYRSKSHQQLGTLETIVATWQQSDFNDSDRKKALLTAHSLAGNLGLFGFDEASQLARELEQVLSDEINQERIWQIEAILQVLRQELAAEANPSPQIACQIQEHSPFLLIIDPDPKLSEQLTEYANSKGIKTLVLTNPESTRIWLEQQSSEQLPDAVLLKLAFSELESNLHSRWDNLSLIAELSLLEPSIPVIVLADRDRFEDRLQVARHGGYFYLKQPLTPTEIISFCQEVFQRSSQGKKVMIVDDDLELLEVLPSLLHPWGFKLTTLHDPRQFWDVLQAVNPNLLVLDIEMPHLSGIELCKVLRTHPYWRKLPVMFLSIHNNVAMRNQVFASGADDFVDKPVVAKHLANRILNRLA
ncbi:multi-component transcriptional regulator, winged helix family [Stanieria cyanosphaera PCC 7437]|uniref:Multi-component transcriptional regulator, winged helix family n=1 Tax=Stanieria cyanosphaera (strain ATCC 29371 / PCC 7437) TaxID=111780 RepID=K9XWN0_STAC7|nr:response regulator [Stanieria cyanosphaera]AFZ36484.1 multi-component transcriptional regulator, winged helix family [Stanieria cyanosphaera PCC 7437]